MSSLNVKSMEKIREDFLRTYRAELIRRGITNPNVSSGTEIYIKATALAQQIAVAMNNTVIKGDALMPDTAQDGDLERLAALYGLTLNPASGSVGSIVLRTTVSAGTAILIPAGSQLQDASGLLYEVVDTVSVADGYNVNIQAIDTGISTNVPVNSVFRWSSIPPFATATALAYQDFVGGGDAEGIEGLRTRLLQKLANPPGGGNWSQIANTAETASQSVQKSFIYPACNGPATCGVAITSSTTVDYKGRDFNGDTTILNNFVIPSVIGNYPEFVDFIITNCVNKEIDVSIGLSIPPAKTANIPGNGDGWMDAIPFPTPIISGSSYVTGYCDVDTAISDTVFTINADASCLPAVLGTTSGTIVNICWLSKNDWILRTAEAYVSGASSPYTVTLVSGQSFLDTANDVPTSGDWIFPNAKNISLYVSRLLEQFNAFGPGQKVDPSTVPGVFPRAYRRPLIQDSWTCDVGPSIIKFLEQSGTEVFDVQYLYRQNVGAGSGKCPIPTSVQTGPFILIPRNIGFYPIL